MDKIIALCLVIQLATAGYGELANSKHYQDPLEFLTSIRRDMLLQEDVRSRAFIRSSTPINMIDQLFPSIGDHEDLFNLKTPDIIKYFGYEAETHHVTTEDGYILELHRIPYGVEDFKNSNGSKTRPVVLLQHCLLCSSSDWVMNKPERALAFLLSEAGYDVWMGNYRGNTYSRNHTKINPDENKEKFWDFSWDQMAVYDLPATIDYILSATESRQLSYVGFSMGTTTFISLMSEKPEYKQKVSVAALLGPVGQIRHIQSPIKQIAPYSDILTKSLKTAGLWEILPSGALMDVAASLCGAGEILAPICHDVIFLICGFDREELNQDYFPVILTHTPAGTSVQTINQYFQNYRSGRFQKYDYGILRNREIYGQDEPPVYEVGAEDTPPVGLFWSDNDWLATPQDVAKLAKEMKNIVLNFRVASEKWNHMDFVWGVHAKEMVYDKLIEFLEGYRGPK